MIETLAVDGRRPARLKAFLFDRRVLLSRRNATQARVGDAGRAGRLGLFFADIKGRGVRRPVTMPPTHPMPKASAIAELFLALRDPLANAREAGQFVNPWALAGLGRHEVRNVAVLAGLWNPVMAGDAGRAFLLKFLERLPKGDANVPNAQDLNRRFVVRTEHCVTGELATRMDLTIEGHDFLIILEAKIDARLRDMQLEDYMKSLERWQCARGKKRTMLVLLAPFAPPAGSPALVARWSDVSAAARASLPSRKNRGITHHLIDAFARHVAQIEG